MLLLALILTTLGLATTPAWSGAAPAAPAGLSAYPWLYRRADPPPQAGAVALIVTGDVMPGRDVMLGGAAAATAPYSSPASQAPLHAATGPLRAVAPWLREADLTLGNLEAVLAPHEPPRTTAGAGDAQPILLSARPQAAAWLRHAGFDLLGLANNHSLDYGPDGLATTVRHLRDAGLTPLGAAPGVAGGATAYEAVIQEVRGVRLAFLAFNAVPDPHPPLAGDGWRPAQWDEARAVAAVRQARANAAAVVVSLHWGLEYDLRAAPWQRAAAQTLVAAGADLVVGHHPHVVQEWAAWPQHNAFVAYSLGNFLFDQQGEHTSQGLALRALFDHHGLAAVQALPVWAGLQPQLMTLSEAEPLLARIAPPAPRLTFACDAAGCAAHDPPTQDDAMTAGLFWSGSIDLTGDGRPELVRRVAERVHIYEAGVEVWASPPQWRVVDVALGDPNDDGRNELVLALWQRDGEGYERSQPFIIGHRGGQYQVIWGGRPVTAPILELALGDVDGDGRQELVVLEQANDAARLSVLRWQGWHFSLHWQSPPGLYADLRLIPRPNNPALITLASHS